ncbi:MAG: sugar phosphate isomerase/epimerase family protein [Planctomycetota bacterium]|jgi:sugar phosphate isomerase/epimerase
MEFCVFSKHLQEYDFGELGRALKSIGITGVDLTVRPKGHVEPERVADDLPRAVEALGAEGVRVTMITTVILAIDEPHAREVLETAAGLGIRFYKFGYYLIPEFGAIRKCLADARAKLADLAAFSKEVGIWGGYHNHSGEEYVGASVPHIAEILADADPEGAGAYFDIGHAFGEGAKGSWKQGFDQLKERIRMVALKELKMDFSPGANIWETVPMGEGPLPWAEFVALLNGIEGHVGPASIHAEYDLPADEVLKLVAADKAFFDNLWSD